MGCVMGRIHYGLKVVLCFSIPLPTIIIIMQVCSQKICKWLWGLSWGGVYDMPLDLSITFVINIYGVECVQLAHFSLGYWKDISIAHVIIIIKSEVSTLPIVIIFSMAVCLRCLLHHILSLIANAFRETGILFSLLLCSLWLVCKNGWRNLLYYGMLREVGYSK